ncbi:GDP-mannose 4,6-dehydratase [Polynucleobacter paneuropaeus]|uniref:GDP-mannose 4,6-dehydratase n=1 Tax=Polynucleobacter paneuropaeus TaxID=2527775 RepID=A0AAE2YLS3_9BURK|nr:GDP-mannose 4,6-dehydratase [Polynucleobacter paneuropaeus]MBT8591846.1 GDP-mannose 4,6-dehydratase [Polynucleobacter paneuropaeus]MBT8597237.1 GDP-mannose 4,6-dehydratase [Polynucleobacter paneuropaeus]MBT8599050.1 GDP-mannose 4,6-dehydratase [Polynucleobacter paneuropaeus]
MMRALICGVTGQDGAYLAQFLLEKGYEVWGTSRDAQNSSFGNLIKLGIASRVNKISMAPNDFRSVLSSISQSNPDEIYNLSGQTSVGLSFEQPAETLESIATGTLNIMEAIRFIGKPIRFYSAGSSECFGDIGGMAANEETRFQPCSPYAVAKATSYWLVENYRAAYGVYSATGILFNHESPLRPSRFVTQKIIKAVVRIANGSDEKLILGSLDVKRDWGWAPEYIKAMWMMLQLNSPEDFVISTGQSHSLKEFVGSAFEYLGLEWNKFVEIDSSLFRPNEISYSCGDSSKAESILGWKATLKMKDVIVMMIRAEQESHNQKT